MGIVELIKEVESLVQEVDKTHRYSMSRIYGLYNQVFSKDEKPQACASCLIRKVKELKVWLEANKPATKVASKPRVKKTAAKKQSDKE